MELMINNSCRDLVTSLAGRLYATERKIELPPPVVQEWRRPPDALLATVNRDTKPT
jgi:hypothetical protein